MKNKFGAAGDFAQANAIQVRMELQTDCLSGVWANTAHRKRDLLEQGDIEEGSTAAAAIGDDTLQRKAQGYVVPESFTHGTAKQRQDWFIRGIKSGDIADCDTFSGDI
jgi:predicted metalloprotease